MRSMMIAPSAAPSIPLRSEPLAMKSNKPQLRTTQPDLTNKDSAVWNVDNIMSLPSIYMLERTHTVVEASPAEIAERISDCMRHESISATYNSREVSERVRLGDNGSVLRSEAQAPFFFK